jgi:protein-ribulosamine 3-kinase
MWMFGGFDCGLFAEYQKLCPKMEPAEEYDDRIALYELRVFLF